MIAKHTSFAFVIASECVTFKIKAMVVFKIFVIFVFSV